MDTKIAAKKIVLGEQSKIPIKSQPFIYLLEDKIGEFNDIEKRYRTLAKKLMNTLQIMVNLINIDDLSDDDKLYYNTYIYGLIPEFLIPAAYIPFNQNDTKENFFRLSFQDKLLDDYYVKLFSDIPKSDTSTPPKAEEIETFKNTLRNYLKDRLDTLKSEKKVYNAFSIKKLVIFSAIFWFLIITFILKSIHYYYHTSYNYIIFVAAILILLLAVVWKMIYTLQ
jgi:hypothetical protein